MRLTKFIKKGGVLSLVYKRIKLDVKGAKMSAALALGQSCIPFIWLGAI